MSKSKRVELKCYLEGVEVNILEVSITNTINTPTVAQIRLPSVNEVSGILRRTIVEIYFTDYDTNTQRLLFKGEVTGHSYSKRQGVPVRTLYAMDAINNLNDLPSQYLNTIGVSGETYEYQFYNIPRDVAGDYVINRDIYTEFDLDTDEGKNILDFVDTFLEMSIGEKAFEKYYQNVGNRYRIKQNHILIETDMYNRLLDATQRNNIIKDIKSGMTYTKKVLDTLIQYVGKYKYTYISMTSPAYTTSSNDNIADTPISGSISKYYSNGLTSYIIMPNCINMVPPKCNVIYADRSVQMTVNISAKTITRLLNTYHLFEERDIEYPLAASIYPLTLSKIASTNGGFPFGKDTEEEDYNLTEEEASTGMVPFSQKKDYLYEILMIDSLRNPENKNRSKQSIAKEYQEFFNNDTAFDFHFMKYRNNVVNITLYGFNPYIVCGLSCIIYDPDGDVYYYGNIVSKTQSINIEQGTSIVNIRMINAREINDIRDITSEKDSEGIYTHNKIMQLLPPEVYCPFNDQGKIVLGSDGHSRLTKEFYSLILKGSDPVNLSHLADKAETVCGWHSVVDEIDTDNNAEDAGNILGLIKDRLEENNGSYGKREIATESEVKYNIYEDNPCKDEKSTNYDVGKRDGFITISDLVTKKYDKDDGKFIYVKERRGAALELKKAISKRIVSL